MARAHPSVERIDPLTSERLACARVLCILCMIWVHVPGAAPDGVGRVLDADHLAATLQALLVEGPGRSSAALLSVVSGWLCARTLIAGRSAGAVVRGRARSILLPMAFWGAVTVAVYAVASVFQPTFLEVRGTLDGAKILRWVNSVIFLTDAPSGPTLHLSFMRDLFVCAALAPVLLAGLRRAPGLLLAALGIVYLTDLPSVVVLRPLVLFAFALGMWIRLRDVDVRRADRYLPVWLVGCAVATFAVVLANGGAFRAADVALGNVGLDLRESVLYPASRLFGSLAVWALTLRLVGTRVGRGIAGAMPWLFTAYCSHFLVLGLLWTGLLEPLGLAHSAGGFTAWFLLAPLVALGLARAIVRVGTTWGPSWTGAVLGASAVPAPARRTGRPKTPRDRPGKPPGRRRATGLGAL